MSHLFGEAFAAQVAGRPDKPAIREGEQLLSYAGLDGRAQLLARALLGQGLRPGELVAAMHDRAIPMTLLFLACQYAGLGLVPLNTGLTAGEVDKVARKTGFSLMVAAPHLAPLSPVPVLVLDAALAGQGGAGAEAFHGWIDRISPPDCPLPALPGRIAEEAAALVISSSGSMGSPKCVQISRAGYRRQIMRQSQVGEVRAEDIFQLVLPLYHAAGLIGVIGVSYACGASVDARLGRFRAEAALAHLEQSGATLTHWIPTMIARVAEHLEQGAEPLPGRLRAIHFGSMHLPEEVRLRAVRALPGLLWQSYGSTECGFISSLEPAELESGRGRSGRLEPGAGPRILDEVGRDVPPGASGEMVMPVELAAMSCYIGEPERTRQTIRNGLVHSGDIVRNDGDGFFTILGRIDAVIVTGGLKVYPSEVEGCILQHAACPEVAVIAVPDPEFGERVCAVLAEAQGDLTLERLREICRPHLAGYKLPRQVEFLPELPRTGSGKIAYGELRSRFGAPPPTGRDTEQTVIALR